MDVVGAREYFVGLQARIVERLGLTADCSGATNGRDRRAAAASRR
jgi:hypothetical protein